MNKVLKIIIILIVIIVTLGQMNMVYATNTTQTQKQTNWKNVFSVGDNFVNKGKNNIIDENGLKNSASSIFRILTIAGIILSVVIGGILGIKFMIASAEDKAQIKEMLIPYIVGCAIIYGAFTIWMIVVNIMEKM